MLLFLLIRVSSLLNPLCLFIKYKTYFRYEWLLKQAISSIKFSRLANSDIKNAIYPLVFLYKGIFCWKRKKMYDIGGMLLYSLIYVIRGGQTSKLEDVILNCERSKPIYPTNLVCFHSRVPPMLGVRAFDMTESL